MPDLADIYPVSAAERRALAKINSEKPTKEKSDEGTSGKGTKAKRKSKSK